MPQSRSETDTNQTTHLQIRFADFMLDLGRGALVRNGQEVQLRRQAYDMLVMLAEHQGELVSKDRLMNTIWNGSVVTENSIAQCLKEIRQAIEDLDHSMIRTIPRRGYIFDVPVERFEVEAGLQSKTGAIQGRWFLKAVAILGVVVVAWWALRSPTPEQRTTDADINPPPLKSVAVLPFVNMSSDPDVTFLADGISEEILNQLAQFPDLLVISRTSSFTFRSPDIDIASIGQQLSVAHVLEGSVRIEGDMARITVQLVNTDNQAHLWSQTYDRSRGHIFELQTDISQDVARQLHSQIADVDEVNVQSAQKPNREAYEAYLRGQSLMARRTPETMAGAMNEFRKAVELDPGFAAAHAGLALSTRFQSETQYGDLPKAQALARAKPYAERALELDPELPEANAAMAYVLVTPDTMEQALFYFSQAVALNPNYADGLMWLSSFLELEGEYKESFELLERAVRADPLSVTALWDHAVSLLNRGRLAEAEKALEKLDSLAPDHHRALKVEVRAYGGQWAQGALAVLESKREDPANSSVDDDFAIFLAAMGMPENALAMTHAQNPLVFELLGRPQAIVKTYQQLESRSGLRVRQEWLLGDALAASGDYKSALRYLEHNWSYMNGKVNVPVFGARSVLSLIEARSALGKEPGSDILIDGLRESLHRYRESGFVRCDLVVCIDFEMGMSAYLSGDHQSALRYLTRAVSSGFLIPPDLTYLQRLYDDPGLAQVFERQRDHVLAQRREFLLAICPENPYADVWQPVEGACD